MTRSPRRGAAAPAGHAAPRRAEAGPPAAASTPLPWWAPLGALGLLALVLLGRALGTGWIADDYLFLDSVRRFPLGELLTGRHAIEGYYRPVSRELYFWLGDHVFGLSAGAMHLLGLCVFAGIGVLLFDLVQRWSGRRAALIAVALFVLYPATGALLAWVSCAQDLVALLFTLAALAVAARGRHALTAPLVFLAALSKETAVVAPLLLLAADVATHAGDRPAARARRLWPAFLGLAAAFAVTGLARATWPAQSHAAWAPAQLAYAWRLPLDLLQTFAPPDLGAGLAAIAHAAVWRIPLVLALGALAVPGAGDAPGATAGALSPARARMLALALIVIAILPLGLIAERWRAYYFVFAGVGTSLALGTWLAQLPPALARTLVAVAALVHLGSNAAYRPLADATGAARHPFVNTEFFRASADVTDRLLAPLEPSCDALRAAPRLFAIGMPSDLVFRTVLGPALRVTCRDTALTVRFLTDFRPDDAGHPFGVIRWLVRDQRLVYEPSNALTLARIGEGFLLHGQYDAATACFEAATRALPDERELVYPRVLGLAAAGHADTARAVWARARAAGLVPAPDTLVARYAYGVAPARRDSARALLRPLVAAAMRDPADAGAASALGRALLTLGLARQATLALSVASGIARQPTDLVWLGEALEADGEPDLAREAYTRGLAAGLPDPVYRVAKARLIALGPEAPGALDH